jgi:hypothetical protein
MNERYNKKNISRKTSAKINYSLQNQSKNFDEFSFADEDSDAFAHLPKFFN